VAVGSHAIRIRSSRGNAFDTLSRCARGGSVRAVP
jgi:hypothetical protein